MWNTSKLTESAADSERPTEILVDYKNPPSWPVGAMSAEEPEDTEHERGSEETSPETSPTEPEEWDKDDESTKYFKGLQGPGEWTT